MTITETALTGLMVTIESLALIGGAVGLVWVVWGVARERRLRRRVQDHLERLAAAGGDSVIEDVQTELLQEIKQGRVELKALSDRLNAINESALSHNRSGLPAAGGDSVIEDVQNG